MDFPATLGRPPAECMYLSGIYGPPDPPVAQADYTWRKKGLYSLSFWALDQFCLNSRPVPPFLRSSSSSPRTTTSRALPARLCLRPDLERGPGLEWAGLTVDEGRNAEAVGREVRISSDESRLAAFAIRAGKAASVSCKTVQKGFFLN
jgi:hypothetical protein